MDSTVFSTVDQRRCPGVEPDQIVVDAFLVREANTAEGVGALAGQLGLQRVAESFVGCPGYRPPRLTGD
jgi:hypothetical protein